MANASEQFLCFNCTEAAEDTAKYIERLGDAPNTLLAFASRYGGDFVGHYCDPDSYGDDRDDDDDDDGEVDCCCACLSSAGSVDPIEAVEAISNTIICSVCYEYVMEYMDAVGMTSEANSQLVVKVMAQRHGGDIDEHECEADDSEETECRCGCQGR